MGMGQMSRYNVYLVTDDGGEIPLGQTTAVSPKKACNNVRWRRFRNTATEEIPGRLEARLVSAPVVKTGGPQLWLPGIALTNPLACFR